MMNERQKTLTRILLTKKHEYLHIEHLARQLACSDKTVRNDLTQIEQEFQNNSQVHLVRKPGIGVFLEVDEDFRSTLFQQLFETETGTDSERLMEIAYQLLANEKPVTLKDFARKYYTNKAVITFDLEKISVWLQQFKLKLVSKQRIGSMIVGDELYKRNALAHLSQLSPTMSDSRNPVLDLFPMSEVAIVRKALLEMKQHFQLSLTDGGFESLLIHALVMISRIRQRAVITLPHTGNVVGSLPERESEMTEWFLHILREKLSISFTESERIYFSWHLMGSKKSEYSSTIVTDQESGSLAEQLTRDLIKKVQQLTMTHFTQDKLLQDGLVIHLSSVIHRMKFGFAITNPLLTEIKKLYPYMFRMILMALEDMNRIHKLNIQEDEAAYLLLHFQAAVERISEEKSVRQRVLIVCHLGVGMSNLLKAKVENQYKGIHILDTIGKMDVKCYLQEHTVDLIISTVPLESSVVPFVVVSPLLAKEDKAKIDQFLQAVKRKEMKTSNGNSQLIPLLKQGGMIPNIRLEHRFEVVELLANQLYGNDMVEKAFIHNALLRERDSATGIGGGIAIPHGQPDLVKQSSVALGVMHQQTEWGTEEVSVVFLLAIANEDKQFIKGVIQHISEISKQPELLCELSGTVSMEQVTTLLSK